jgi:Na+/H+ antiporter NhaD/arsenite permease-like protein
MAGTAALFAPVAVAVARALGHPPEPYVVMVALAAVVSFLTPIGHHGNLVVYGAGGYPFADFVWVGAAPHHPYRAHCHVAGTNRLVRLSQIDPSLGQGRE